MQANDWAAARTRLELCVSHYPSSSVARRLLGRAFAETGQVDRAEEELKMAVALEPRIAEHQADLGLFYLRHQRMPDGVQCLLDAFALDPTLRDRVRAVPHLFDALPDAERARLFGT